MSRFIEQSLLKRSAGLPFTNIEINTVPSTSFVERSEVSGILNLRANKLDKNDYFRCMKQKPVLVGVRRCKLFESICNEALNQQ